MLAERKTDQEGVEEENQRMVKNEEEKKTGAVDKEAVGTDVNKKVDCSYFIYFF